MIADSSAGPSWPPPSMAASFSGRGTSTRSTTAREAILPGRRGVRARALAPGRGPPRRAGVGDAFIEIVFVSGCVVEPMDDRLQVEPGIAVGGAQGDGNLRQAVPQADRPEPGARP